MERGLRDEDVRETRGLKIKSELESLKLHKMTNLTNNKNLKFCTCAHSSHFFF